MKKGKTNIQNRIVHPHNNSLKAARKEAKKFCKTAMIFALILTILICLFELTGQKRAEAIFTISIDIILPVVLAFLGGGTLINIVLHKLGQYPDVNTRLLRIKIIVILFILLFSSSVQAAFAQITIALVYDAPSEPNPPAEPEEPETPSGNTVLEIFDWKADLYPDNIEKYMGKDATDKDIPQMIKYYLETDMLILTKENSNSDYTAYEEHIADAQEYHKDFENIATNIIKIYACHLECNERTSANTCFTSIDNLKLTGDCYVMLGDLCSDDKKKNYENALYNYIDALHALYSTNIGTSISKKVIWETIYITYAKIEKLGTEETDRAGVMANICKNMI